MLFYTVGQSRIFLTMLYAGMLIGIYSTLDGAARRLFEAGRLLGVLLDLLFGTAAAAIVIFALLICADGELRLYSLLGTICGYILYMSTFDRLLKSIFKLIAKPVRRIFSGISRSRLMRRIFK